MKERSNLGRVLTLVVEIIDNKESEWIWANLKGNKCNGVDVFCISNGDAVEDLERLEQIDEGL